MHGGERIATITHRPERRYCMYLQRVMYLFHCHRVKCKLVEVHCDRYAFHLNISIPFVWWWQLYTYTMHIQISTRACITVSTIKTTKPTWLQCLWLIENKSLPMYGVVSFYILWMFFFFSPVHWRTRMNKLPSVRPPTGPPRRRGSRDVAPH